MIMGFDEDLLALFDQYNAGKLTDVEVNSFESRLISDESFKSDYQAYQTIRSGIANTGYEQLRQNIATWEAKLSEEPSQRKSKNWFGLGLAASVSLIIMIGAWWMFLSKPSNEEIFASYYKAYPNVVSDRGDNNELNEGLFEYSLKNYQTAENKLNKYLKDHPENLQVLFYLGQSQLAVGNTEKAIHVFEELLKKGQFPLNDATEWYLSLAYLKEGQNIKTIELLNLITLDNNHAYGTQAEQLLKTIN